MTTTIEPSAAGASAPTRGQAMRRGRDRVFWALCILSFLVIVAPTLAVIGSVIDQALPALGWHTFTQVSNGTSGGLREPILGTLVLLLGVLIVGGTVGVGAGIYLAEFSTSRFGSVLRFLSEILAGIPSIVIGYVGFTALVVGLHWQYSLLAAVLALSVLVLPYIVKTTEVALRQVPTALREASAGLGLTRGRTVARILLPTALPGIVSGLIIALAISTGETAPLLYTAGPAAATSALSAHLTHAQVPYLTGVTFFDVSQPGGHPLAAAAAAVTLLILLILIFIGRAVSRRARKATARMAL